MAANRAETRVDAPLHVLLLLGEVPQTQGTKLRGVRRQACAAKGRMAGSHPA